jgi:hypothetical protein
MLTRWSTILYQMVCTCKSRAAALHLDSAVFAVTSASSSIRARQIERII